VLIFGSAQGLHREALARWLNADGEESCADDELTSCGGEPRSLEMVCWRIGYPIGPLIPNDSNGSSSFYIILPMKMVKFAGIFSCQTQMDMGL
jgi:hypothetical protein